MLRLPVPKLMTRLLLVLAAFAAVLTVRPYPASARGRASSPSVSEADQKRASRLFGAAKAAADAGDYRKAARLLEDAHRLDPDPGLMLSAANMYVRCGDFRVAAMVYRRIAADKTIVTNLREESKRRLDRISPKLGTAWLDFPRAAGMAVADFDLDGDLDVATSFSRMRCDANCAYTTPEVHLFRNERGNDANALQIRLRGSGRGGTNVSGVGAEVRVTAGGITQVRELSAGNGHQGVQNTLMLHFGLAGECTAESVEVRWNDAAGTVQTFEDVPANYPVTLVEGVEQPQWPTWDGGE